MLSEEADWYVVYVPTFMSLISFIYSTIMMGMVVEVTQGILCWIENMIVSFNQNLYLMPSNVFSVTSVIWSMRETPLKLPICTKIAGQNLQRNTLRPLPGLMPKKLLHLFKTTVCFWFCTRSCTIVTFTLGSVEVPRLNRGLIFFFIYERFYLWEKLL